MSHQIVDEIAKNEPPVQAETLLEEILPLMEEYFVGEVSLVGKELVYRMPNGQSFKITAESI